MGDERAHTSGLEGMRESDVVKTVRRKRRVFQHQLSHARTSGFPHRDTGWGGSKKVKTKVDSLTFFQKMLAVPTKGLFFLQIGGVNEETTLCFFDTLACEGNERGKQVRSSLLACAVCSPDRRNGDGVYRKKRKKGKSVRAHITDVSFSPSSSRKRKKGVLRTKVSFFSSSFSILFLCESTCTEEGGGQRRNGDM